MRMECGATSLAQKVYADLSFLPVAFHKYDCHKGVFSGGLGVISGAISNHTQVPRALAILDSCGKLDC